jgi:ring-1,2-phenylacetyl-CoA epoxidase subunit PaaA
MAQGALDRWWWPSLMMFGPSDRSSPNSGELMRWKVKLKSNDELRQRFIDITIPQGLAIGLTFPDPQLEYDAATGHWRHGEPDWDEFKRVIAGHGPCNAERIEARRRAWDDGAWVRDAASAYAAKHQAPVA